MNKERQILSWLLQKEFIYLKQMQFRTVNVDWHDSLFTSNRHHGILAHKCHTAKPDE